MTDFETMIKNNEDFKGTKLVEEKLNLYNKLAEYAIVLKKVPGFHVDADKVENTHPNCAFRVTMPAPAFIFNGTVKNAFAEMFKLAEDVSVAHDGANTVLAFGVTGIWEEK